MGVLVVVCTSYCSCQGSEECFNNHTKQVEIELDDDYDYFFHFVLSSYMPANHPWIVQEFDHLSRGPVIRSMWLEILTFWLAIMVYIMFAIFLSFV